MIEGRGDGGMVPGIGGLELTDDLLEDGPLVGRQKFGLRFRIVDDLGDEVEVV